MLNTTAQGPTEAALQTSSQTIADAFRVVSLSFTHTHKHRHKTQAQEQEVSASSPQWDRSSAKEIRPLDLWTDELDSVENRSGKKMTVGFLLNSDPDDVFHPSFLSGGRWAFWWGARESGEGVWEMWRPLCRRSIQQVQSIQLLHERKKSWEARLKFQSVAALLDLFMLASTYLIMILIHFF